MGSRVHGTEKLLDLAEIYMHALVVKGEHNSAEVMAQKAVEAAAAMLHMRNNLMRDARALDEANEAFTDSLIKADAEIETSEARDSFCMQIGTLVEDPPEHPLDRPDTVPAPPPMPPIADSMRALDRGE